MRNNLFQLCCKTKELFERPETREIYVAEQPYSNPEAIFSSYRIFSARPTLTHDGCHADIYANSCGGILVGFIDKFVSGLGYPIAEAVAGGIGTVKQEKYPTFNGEGTNLMYIITKRD